MKKKTSEVLSNYEFPSILGLCFYTLIIYTPICYFSKFIDFDLLYQITSLIVTLLFPIIFNFTNSFQFNFLKNKKEKELSVEFLKRIRNSLFFFFCFNLFLIFIYSLNNVSYDLFRKETGNFYIHINKNFFIISFLLSYLVSIILPSLWKLKKISDQALDEKCLISKTKYERDQEEKEKNIRKKLISKSINNVEEIKKIVFSLEKNRNSGVENIIKFLHSYHDIEDIKNLYNILLFQEEKKKKKKEITKTENNKNKTP